MQKCMYDCEQFLIKQLAPNHKHEEIFKESTSLDEVKIDVNDNHEKSLAKLLKTANFIQELSPEKCSILLIRNYLENGEVKKLAALKGETFSSEFTTKVEEYINPLVANSFNIINHMRAIPISIDLNSPLARHLFAILENNTTFEKYYNWQVLENENALTDFKEHINDELKSVFRAINICIFGISTT